MEMIGIYTSLGASQVMLVIKNLSSTAGDLRNSFEPWVGKNPLEEGWQRTPVFLPEESHGQSSLVSYSS